MDVGVAAIIEVTGRSMLLCLLCASIVTQEAAMIIPTVPPTYMAGPLRWKAMLHIAIDSVFARHANNDVSNRWSIVVHSGSYSRPTRSFMDNLMRNVICRPPIAHMQSVAYAPGHHQIVNNWGTLLFVTFLFQLEQLTPV